MFINKVNWATKLFGVEVFLKLPVFLSFLFFLLTFFFAKKTLKRGRREGKGRSLRGKEGMKKRQKDGRTVKKKKK